MNSRESLKWHILFFKICGVWHPEHGSILYTLWSLFFSFIVYIAFSISLLVCVFFVDSVNKIVDHMIITSSVIMVAVKAYNVLVMRKQFDELLILMQELDDSTTIEEHRNIFQPIFKESDFLFKFFCFSYLSTWSAIALQVIVSPPDERTWPSTYLYPIKYLHHPFIYVGGLFCQGISNFFVCSMDVAEDTYGASLLHILGGHIMALGQRLSDLGNTNKIRQNTVDSYQHKFQLIECCKRYILILRLLLLSINSCLMNNVY